MKLEVLAFSKATPIRNEKGNFVTDEKGNLCYSEESGSIEFETETKSLTVTSSDGTRVEVRIPIVMGVVELFSECLSQKREIMNIRHEIAVRRLQQELRRMKHQQGKKSLTHNHNKIMGKKNT